MEGILFVANMWKIFKVQKTCDRYPTHKRSAVGRFSVDELWKVFCLNKAYARHLSIEDMCMAFQLQKTYVKSSIH